MDYNYTQTRSYQILYTQDDGGVTQIEYTYEAV